MDSACLRLLAAHDVPDVQSRSVRRKNEITYEGEGERGSEDSGSSMGNTLNLGPGSRGKGVSKGKGKDKSNSKAVSREGLESRHTDKDTEKDGYGGYTPGTDRERSGTAPQSLGSTGVTGSMGTTGSTGLAGSSSQLTFEEFSASPAGVPLHAAYEGAKSALQENKTTQRQITCLLNKLKACIDALQLQLQTETEAEAEEEREEEGEGEEEGKGEGKSDNESKRGDKKNGKQQQQRQQEQKVKRQQKEKEKEKGKCSGNTDIKAVEAELAGIKKDFRLSSKELELCKVQVAEIQTLKKMALSALLQAFEAQNGS